MPDDKKKKKMPAWVNQKPGSVAIEDRGEYSNSKIDYRALKESNERGKKYRPKGDAKIPVKKEPVERGEYSRESSGLKSLMTGKIKDAIDPSMLKVNPKYQKRVNKVLGE